MAQVKILIVEDHKLFREVLSERLSQHANYVIVAETDNGADAVSLVSQKKPDLVLIDVNLRGMNGLDALRLIRAAEHECRVLVLSMLTDAASVGRAISLGAAGYVVKEEAYTDLLQAIAAVLAGRRYISPSLNMSLDKLPQDDASADVPTDQLTAKEQEILILIASGLSNAEMSRHLGRSVKTIEAHRANLSNKLGLKGTAELTRYAIREALIRP